MTHYIKSFWNFYSRNKSLSLLSLFGLSFGLFSMLLNGAQLVNEYSFNKDIPDYEYTYRVIIDDEGFAQAQTPFQFNELIKEEIPEITKSGRIASLNYSIGFAYCVKNGQKIKIENFYTADKEALNLLGIVGLHNEEINNLNHGDVIISESMAKMFFGKTDVRGEVFPISHKRKLYHFKIAQVFKDIDWNHTHQPQVICNPDFYVQILNKQFGFNREKMLNSLESGWIETFIKRNKNTTEKVFIKKFVETANGLHEKRNLTTKVSLQRLDDIYFESDDLHHDPIEKGNRKNILYYKLSILIILIFTVFNYVIISISISTQRNIEIGIRKVFGASKWVLMRQFFIESFFITLISIPIVLLISVFYSQYLSPLLMLKFHFYSKNILCYILWGIAALGLLALLSSSYTSFYLSSLSPVGSLYGDKISKKNKTKVLYYFLGFQVFVSFILIIISTVFYSQMDYAINKSSSFNIDKVQLVHFETKLKSRDYLRVKKELLSDPNIISVTGGIFLPPSNSSNARNFALSNDENNSIVCEIYKVNSDFFKTYEIDLLKGRYFDFNEGGDIDRFIILNKTAYEKFGLRGIDDNQIEGRIIIGVVEDFKYHSLHHEIKPMIFFAESNNTWKLAIKHLNPITPNSKNILKDKLDDLLKNKTITIFTYREILQELYKKDINLLNTILFYTIVLILLSIFGMVGLTLFFTNNERKNICIHLVYGASSKEVFYIFTKRILYLLIISTVLAIPIALGFIYNWLSYFSEHQGFPISVLYIISIIWISILIVNSVILLRTVNYSPTKYLR